MSRQRSQSTVEGQKEAHSVSLKVLRLSRPSISEKYSLTVPSHSSEAPRITPNAWSSYPAADPDDSFALEPLLTLPPAFGSAYVGETFSCTLCANNEVADGTSRVINSVRIAAEMKTPSQTIPLDLLSNDDEEQLKKPLDLGNSSQRIVRFDLKEEGNHVLAVTVTYSETIMSGTGEMQAAGGRVRTFRKLYQFLAQQGLAVRTKAGDLPAKVVPHPEKTVENMHLMRFAFEAQLENVSENAITLTDVTLNPRSPFKSTSLNWETIPGTDEQNRAPVLKAHEVQQVAFYLEQQPGDASGAEALSKDLATQARANLGQLTIAWTTAMGDKCSLSTGNIYSRRR